MLTVRLLPRLLETFEVRLSKLAARGAIPSKDFWREGSEEYKASSESERESKRVEVLVCGHSLGVLSVLLLLMLLLLLLLVCGDFVLAVLLFCCDSLLLLLLVFCQVACHPCCDGSIML